jgi:hypothetical protein
MTPLMRLHAQEGSEPLHGAQRWCMLSLVSPSNVSPIGPTARQGGISGLRVPGLACALRLNYRGRCR